MILIFRQKKTTKNSMVLHFWPFVALQIHHQPIYHADAGMARRIVIIPFQPHTSNRKKNNK